MPFARTGSFLGVVRLSTCDAPVSMLFDGDAVFTTAVENCDKVAAARESDSITLDQHPG
jgi:hypothetical protein